MDDLAARFFGKISPGPGDCIDWTGAKLAAGYGRISFEGRLVPATHVSWFLRHGVWPTKHILHTCDRPSCVKPQHLFEGTDLDNARDRDAKGRHRALRGEDAPWSRLTDAQVGEIVALTETRMSNDEIGRRYGVAGVYVSSLRHGRFRHSEGGRSRKPRSALMVVVGDEYLTVAEIAERAGVSQETVRHRIREGVTGEQLLAAKHKSARKPYTRRK